jgi:hypothetical protein
MEVGRGIIPQEACIEWMRWRGRIGFDGTMFPGRSP